MLILFVVFLFLVFLFALKLYLNLNTGRCNSNIVLSGKTAIVTGGTSGIGYETALDFAKRGAKVILASIEQKVGKRMAEKITQETNNTNVVFKYLDLSSIKSVRQFAEEINQSEERLDILVNNAGALYLPPKKSEDGLLLLMQTNYFGPFLLTNLLLDLMIKTQNSRIVNVVSWIAMFESFTNLDIDHLNSFPKHGLMKDLKVYARSKLCALLFTIELAHRLKGTKVTTYSVHPGMCASKIALAEGQELTCIHKFLAFLLCKTAEEGAQTSIHCSIATGIEHLSGENFHDCHVVKRYKTAEKPDLPKKLWTVTEKLLNVKF